MQIRWLPLSHGPGSWLLRQRFLHTWSGGQNTSMSGRLLWARPRGIQLWRYTENRTKHLLEQTRRLKLTGDAGFSHWQFALNVFHTVKWRVNRSVAENGPAGFVSEMEGGVQHFVLSFILLLANLQKCGCTNTTAAVQAVIWPSCIQKIKSTKTSQEAHYAWKCSHMYKGTVTLWVKKHPAASSQINSKQTSLWRALPCFSRALKSLDQKVAHVPPS